jgi:hypothetical protein
MTPGAPEATPKRPATEGQAQLWAREWTEEQWRRISGRRGTVFDWSLLVLAVISVGLNLWFLLGPQPPYAGRRLDWHQSLLAVDLGVCAVFALAICFRWLRFRIGRRYLRRHWWEVPALVPFVLPVVTDHHWLMWLVLAARAARLADRADNIFGDRFTAALVRHFADPIVDAIKRPITIAVLDEVVDVVKKGTYTANIRSAIDENRAELEAMVLDLVRRDQKAGRLRFLPFHDDVVRSTTDTVLRILDGALDDPRTAELVSDVIRNSADQLRRAVRERR